MRDREIVINFAKGVLDRIRDVSDLNDELQNYELKVEQFNCIHDYLNYKAEQYERKRIRCDYVAQAQKKV